MRHLPLSVAISLALWGLIGLVGYKACQAASAELNVLKHVSETIAEALP